MKMLVGRGPVSIVTHPKRHLRELAGFEIDEHTTGWTATRRAGMLVDTLSLEATVSESEIESLEPDAEVGWKVTVRSGPDRTWYGGPTAVGSTLVSGAVAFWITYDALDWLPRKPSVHFASATLLLVVTFGVMLTVLYMTAAAISKRLVARMEQRPTRAMLERLERLVAFAEGIPRLGLTPVEEPSSP